MTHQFAEQSDAADRYLLNEMGAKEQAEFEKHYFDCPICAERVREAAAFAENTEAVMREQPAYEPGKAHRNRNFFLTALRPAILAPYFVSLCLIALVSYQNAVVLPSLRSPQVLSTAVIAPMARDAAPRVTIDAEKALFNANFTVDAPRLYSRYVCQFRKMDGPPVLNLDCGAHQSASFILSLLLPGSKFPDGTYELILRSVENGGWTERYTFAIQREHRHETAS